jgi:hypothetical protein
VQRCGEVVDEQKVAGAGPTGLMEAEKRVLEFINSVGPLNLQEVAEGAVGPLVRRGRAASTNGR